MIRPGDLNAIDVYDDPPSCTNCIFKYNEMLGCLSPCNMCISFSEYRPIDKEACVENWWLDDPIVVDQVITEIDNIVEKIDILDNILPSMGISERCFNSVEFLKGIKKTIVDVLIKDSANDPYTPCYKGTESDCNCSNDKCSFPDIVCPF